jgi:hypothetical protein
MRYPNAWFEAMAAVAAILREGPPPRTIDDMMGDVAEAQVQEIRRRKERDRERVRKSLRLVGGTEFSAQ